jgi:outer membrane protein OmpA-like peptidoglycan-associated protein
VTQLNTNDHDGSIALSPEGNKLFIYRYGDIWEAGWDGKSWNKPERMHQEIDAKSSVEPSMCLSADGNTMYFISDRKGGMGGKDIWMCQKSAGGNWGKPENPGPKINSAANEESPFLSKDGEVLYFSSEGHNSMGGYDVFKSVRDDDGSWKSPENLGAPINNGGDDVFYTPDASGNFAYYATLNRYGEGNLDIYSVMYYPEVQPMAKLRIPKDISLPENARITLSLKVANGEDKTYSLAAGDSVIYNYTPGQEAIFTVTAPGFQTATGSISYSTGNSNYCLQDISMNSGNNFMLNSYFFDIDNAVDADTLLDMVADRKLARTAYIGQLTAINDVYTGWNKNSVPFALDKTGTSTDAGPMLVASDLKPGTDIATLQQLLNPVLFDFNESFIRDDMKAGLDRIANQMKKDPTLKLEISGHADSKGDDKYNLRLSQNRANAVRNYFIICGIPANRLLVAGEGEMKPVEPNTRDGQDNPAGRSRNRRVEMNFVR